MSEYRKLLTNAKKLVEQAAQERANVVKEGRKDEWNREQYRSIKERYTKLANTLTDQMFRASLEEFGAAKKEADKKRKKPSSPLNQVDGSEKLYHLQRAEMLLGGQDEQEAIKEYGYIASTLDDKEKNFRYIYEDVLMAKVQDPANRIHAEQEIFKYKPDDEKEAITVAREAWRVKEMNKTIANHLLHDIEQVASGVGDPPAYEYTEFIDGKTQKEIDQSKNIEADGFIREAMKNEQVNPYAEGDTVRENQTEGDQ